MNDDMQHSHSMNYCAASFKKEFWGPDAFAVVRERGQRQNTNLELQHNTLMQHELSNKLLFPVNLVGSSLVKGGFTS